jgi:hypothetical protein
MAGNTGNTVYMIGDVIVSKEAYEKVQKQAESSKLKAENINEDKALPEVPGNDEDI